MNIARARWLCYVWKLAGSFCKYRLKLTHLSRNLRPLAVTEYLMGLLWISSNPASWSSVRYFPTVFQDMFALCIILVLFCGLLQKLNISAITSNLVLLSKKHHLIWFSAGWKCRGYKDSSLKLSNPAAQVHRAHWNDNTASYDYSAF